MTEVDGSVGGQTEKNQHEKARQLKQLCLILFIRINRHISFQGNIYIA